MHDELPNLLARQEILAALVIAVEDPARLIEAVVAGEDLADSFGITDIQAQVLGDMQVRRFSPRNREVIRAEYDEISSQVAALRDQGGGDLHNGGPIPGDRPPHG